MFCFQLRPSYIAAPAGKQEIKRLGGQEVEQR